MNKTLLIFSITFILIAFASCQSNESKEKSQEQDSTITQESKELQSWAQKVFKVLPSEAPNPDNPVTEVKAELGKQLYFDNILSKNQNISCNSCHDIRLYGVDTLSVSPGDDGTLGTRNSPTVFNAALHISQFWDGREPDVEAQAGGPVTNPVEMQMASEEDVVKRLKAHDSYPELFKQSFDEEEPISFENITKAIAAYERLLLTPAPFDKYLEGDANALTEKQIAGLKDFKEAACFTCHSGSLLGGSMYQKFGTEKKYWEYTNSSVIDSGVYVETRDPKDIFVFKVPSLRNVEMTYPYFHDGSVRELARAIDIMAKVSLDKELSKDQIDNISAFLSSLTGEIKEEWIPEGM
jgi:cytochrome c peroxidase